MYKEIKARKEWICDKCGGVIHKGEVYCLEESRFPKYDDNDNQIGVEFYKHRYHNRECINALLYVGNPKVYIENCSKGIHSWAYHKPR